MDSLVGQHLGRYEIVEKIGRAGMAEVYRAFEAGTTREVVIRVLPPSFAADSDFLQAFRNEGRLVASLDHPNIIPIDEVDEAGGRPFIVTRWVRGRSLGERLKAGPLHPTEILKWGGQIASALDYAHARHVVHRDLQPASVLIDSKGDALVADFGLAKMAQAAGEFPEAGLMLGAPDYAAPEGMQGESMDHRADLYSFGALLYAMLTGRPPHAPNTPVGVLSPHRYDPIPSAREHNPSLPSAVDRFFRRALATNPDDRYPSAPGMMADLTTALQPVIQSTRAAPAAARGVPLDGGDEWLPPVEDESWFERVEWRTILWGSGLLTLVFVLGIAGIALIYRFYVQGTDLLPGGAGGPLPLTGGGVATVSDVVGPLNSRAAGGEPVPVYRGQSLEFAPGRTVVTGADPNHYATLDLPAGARVFLGQDTEVELAEASERGVSLTLNRGRMMVLLPDGFPIDMRFVVTAPNGAATRVSGSLMGVLFDPGTGTLLASCLEGHCWAATPQGESPINVGETVLVDSAMTVDRRPGTMNELWIFSPGIVPFPTPVPYGAGFAWRDRFDLAEQQRARTNDSVLWPISGMLSAAALGVWLVSFSGRRGRRE